MANLVIETVSADGLPIVALNGELDAYHAPRLREQLEALNTTLVIVDLRQVSYVDSTGLGVLVAARKRADSQGGALRLVVSESSAVHRTLTITGLMTIFQIFPDAVAARA